MGGWAEVTPSSNETTRGHVCKMLWRRWRDFLALFVVVFVWCRRLRQARWHLKRNASKVRTPLSGQRQRLSERDGARDGSTIASKLRAILFHRCRLQNWSQVPCFSDGNHFIPQPQCIWHAGSLCVREIGSGTFCFFFLLVQREHLCCCCCCSSTSRH